MSPGLLLVVYCALIVVASVSGGVLPSMIRLNHLRTQLLMSFVAGLMLAIGMLHLLPHAVEEFGPSQSGASKAGAAALSGMVAMFLLMRLFHAHDHDIPFDEVDGDEDPDGHEHHAGHVHQSEHHLGRLDREEEGESGHLETAHGHKKISWAGMMFGLALHTMIDGVALASSVAADSVHDAWLGLFGLGTFLAVFLHKPLDSFAITSLMQKQGWTPGGRNVANLAFSLSCPIGALLFYFGVSELANQSGVLGWGLAVSAGFFICIALSDLLPEVAFHDHDRGKLTAALLVGVALAIGVENLPGHDHNTHDHTQQQSHPSHEHPADAHEH